MPVVGVGAATAIGAPADVSHHGTQTRSSQSSSMYPVSVYVRAR